MHPQHPKKEAVRPQTDMAAQLSPSRMACKPTPRTSMHHCTLLHAKRSTHTAINMLTIVTYPSCLPSPAPQSSRMHGEFLRLLFLQAHRETTAHFTAIGMPAQQHCDSFRFRRAYIHTYRAGATHFALRLISLSPRIHTYIQSRSRSRSRRPCLQPLRVGQ